MVARICVCAEVFERDSQGEIVGLPVQVLLDAVIGRAGKRRGKGRWGKRDCHPFFVRGGHTLLRTCVLLLQVACSCP